METSSRAQRTSLRRQTLGKLWLTICVLYFAALFGWLLLYLLFDDGMGYLGLANALAVYFFLPLPLATLLAWRVHNRPLLSASLVGALAFAALWGPLFWPNPPVATNGPDLRVMSFNVLGRRGDPEAVLASIVAEDADLVFLQEVTPDIAWLINNELPIAYPYRVLAPDAGASGLGVLSKYPLEESGIALNGGWMGKPQVLHMDWQGQAITLVNIHTRPTGSIWPRLVRYTFDQRQADIAYLTDFVAARSGPVIVGGDANMTHLNTAYKILIKQLDDAWWQAGFGLGHTFPGPVNSGDWGTRVGHFLIPPWLVRIDYVFISDDWQAANAWLAEFHGGSDHRGLVTELVLLP